MRCSLYEHCSVTGTAGETSPLPWENAVRGHGAAPQLAVAGPCSWIILWAFPVEDTQRSHKMKRVSFPTKACTLGFTDCPCGGEVCKKKKKKT